LSSASIDCMRFSMASSFFNSALLVACSAVGLDALSSPASTAALLTPSISEAISNLDVERPTPLVSECGKKQSWMDMN
jgi:hypothetical protein